MPQLIFVLLSLIPLLLSLFVLTLMIGNLFGPPFVPIQKKVLEMILKRAKLKKGQIVYDLGSGDGRVIRLAVRKYRVRGYGVEINPFLVAYSRIISKLRGIKDCHFLNKNFFDCDFSKAEVIFVYLLPQYLSKLKNKLIGECRKGTLIVSWKFPVEGWERYLYQRAGKEKVSYFYRL